MYRKLQNIKYSRHTMIELVSELINGREDQQGTSPMFKTYSFEREFFDTTTSN
jgi:hypothetical protein